MKRIILDTDIGPDCDDCGALAVLMRYRALGLIDLLGVTHCTSDVLGAYTVCAINEYFGADVPVGQTEREDFLVSPDTMKFTRPIGEDYIKTHGERVFETSVHLLRRLLAENNGVTLLFIGPLNDFAELLRSEGDGVSPLSGIGLVRKAVSEVVVMGGNFASPSTPEFNIYCDAGAAAYCAENCPVKITYCGFEAGEDVVTGAVLAKDGGDDSYPIRRAYRLYCGEKCLRPSWDLVTALYAAAGCGGDEAAWSGFTYTPHRGVIFTSDGKTVADGGNVCAECGHITPKDKRRLAEYLDSLIAE